MQVGEPVAPAGPEAMMQALNDDLERVVRAHMDQWFWIHRRWKPRRQKRMRGDDPALPAPGPETVSIEPDNRL